MSAAAPPITPARFAQALESLSVSSLHAKAAELRNSIAHLEKSNAELEDYVREEQDGELYEAVLENREVIARMEERIELIKKEVTEVRSLPWAPADRANALEPGERPSNGAGSATNGVIGGGAAGGSQERTGGTGTAGTEEEEGVFL